ncbi:hypothetical protein SAMN05421647_104240 [Marinobacterium stanieri]|uniref:Uncharacterized protein n=1 Tax=Marinobacterium stanieri TaxID=49186 RepID=A0A1N6SFN6_9GAMM|nr:hypothetical protein SAMN05421647_104240 [Marinobacterium stanieri]
MWELSLRAKVFRPQERTPQHRVRGHIWWIVMLEMWEPFLREKIFRARSALPQQYRVEDDIW